MSFDPFANQGGSAALGGAEGAAAKKAADELFDALAQESDEQPGEDRPEEADTATADTAESAIDDETADFSGDNH